MSGGAVFAMGGRGRNEADVGGDKRFSLEISGSAVLFLRNDRSTEPETTHTHKQFNGHTAGNTVNNIPVNWDGDFGAWLPLSDE